MGTQKLSTTPLTPKGSKRIVFTFDERSLMSLERVRQKLGAKSLAEAVRISLALADSLQKQAEKGFIEVVTRSPRTGKERVMGGPALVSTGRSDG
jgi:hypothetical protein